MRWTGRAVALAAGVCLSGCTVGPKYQRASVPTPPAWKTEGPWRQATPKDSVPKGAWWEIFHEEELNQYEQQLLAANQSLIAARDRLDQAHSFARVASAGLFPVANIDPSASRNRYSGNRPEILTSGTPLTQNVFTIPFALNYEVDLFGRARKNLAAANASLEGTAADLENVQLVLTAELAADYFSLRELDSEYQVVEESVKIQREGLDVVRHRHEGGIASGLDLAQQQTLLDSTVAQLSLVQQQRARFEHAIAVLTGNPASIFSVPVAPLKATAPPVPLGMPSDLLERRPDVATAERGMAQQNALVGYAKTSFYPQLTLSGSGGFQSIVLGSLVTAPSAFWSLGGDLVEPIFNGGRNRANLAASQSAYDESVANYRQSVLLAFQQVEDSLSDLNSLSQASQSQTEAVSDSRRALDIANNRYVGGLTNFLDVITAQSVLLSNERLATQLLGQQMVASVYLVKALGGGWDASAIQNEQVHPQPSQIMQP
jgi:outer membrane protein, multidrug efflux system